MLTKAHSSCTDLQVCSCSGTTETTAKLLYCVLRNGVISILGTAATGGRHSSIWQQLPVAVTRLRAVWQITLLETVPSFPIAVCFLGSLPHPDLEVQQTRRLDLETFLCLTSVRARSWTS